MNPAQLAQARPLAVDAAPALPPAPADNIIAKVITGDYRKDVLLEDLSDRWNVTAPVGTKTQVTFSFAADVPSYAAADDAKGFTAFTPELRAAARDILAKISQIINVTFVEVSDSAASYGQIRFASNDQGTVSAGYAYLPGSTESPLDGDVYMATGYEGTADPGSAAYATLLHEIGHALGLKHPGNYNAGESRDSSAIGNFLNKAEDDTAHTVMSYRESPQGLQPDSLAPFDVLTLRYLYGAKAVNTGDTTYALGEGNGSRMTTIVDDGGTDTVDLSAVVTNAVFSLQPGSINSVGSTVDNVAAVNNVALALDARIERLIGGGGSDTLTGNELANLIQGGPGDDTISGGGGIDTAAYAGTRANFTLARTDTGWTVADSSGVEGTDTLDGVERLTFSDTAVALDLEGNAGTVAKLVGALLGKDALGNKVLVGLGLGLLDRGMSETGLADALVGKDLFAQAAGSHSNTDFVTLVYKNVVGELPDADALANFVGLLDSGAFTQGTLAVLAAETGLNQAAIDLVGLATTGLEFTPYAG